MAAMNLEPAVDDAVMPGAQAASLADALDRLLNRGVALQGNVALGLAGVDLLFLDVRAVLGSIDTVWPDGMPSGFMDLGPKRAPAVASVVPPVEAPAPPNAREKVASPAMASAAISKADAKGQPAPDHAAAPAAKGLVRLVLTIVKLVHDVMERQALRRMDNGRLNAAEIECVGLALYAQAREIERLRQSFGLTERDLRLALSLFEDAS